MLEIRAPRIFRHPGQLAAREASPDPRERGFPWDEVCINLRTCESVHPPAILWCAVYAALVHEAKRRCELVLPEDAGVAAYLNAAGLFRTMAELGVAFDNRSLGDTGGSQVIMPLRRFTTVSAAEDMENEILDRLSAESSIAGNLAAFLSSVFAELANNAPEHAESPIGAFGMLQLDELRRKRRLSCVVADGGIGIMEALSRNPAVCLPAPFDWVAIEHSLREHVSGTESLHRGLGLFKVSEDMRSPGCELIIHSGFGMVVINQQSESLARRCRVRFPGTLAAGTISL